LRILQRRADRGLELPTRTFADVRYGSWAAKFIEARTDRCAAFERV